MQNQSENRVYAGFFVRLIAFAIDSLLAAIVAGMLKSPFSAAAMVGVDFFDKSFLFHHSFLDVLGYVGVAAYFVLITYFTHTTPGKKLLRLEVVTESGDWTMLNVLYRETIGRFLSSLLCIGYLAVIVQERKQGFHDMLCDTYVVYKDAVLKTKKVLNLPPLPENPVYVDSDHFVRISVENEGTENECTMYEIFSKKERMDDMVSQEVIPVESELQVTEAVNDTQITE